MNTLDKDHLAKAIRDFRLSQFKTQEQFAELLDITAKQYQNFEQARSKPSLKVLYKLFELGFSIDSAFHGEDSESRSKRMEEIKASLQLCPDDDLVLIQKIVTIFLKYRG